MYYCRCVSLAILLCLVGLSTANETQYGRPNLLVEPSDLAKPRIADEFIILDAREQGAYEREHIPGARRVDHEAWKSAFGDGTDVQGWSELIGELGISADSKAVVYDDATAKDAARIWWILRYWGLEDVRLLNGGWKAWKAQGLPTSTAAHAPAERTEFAATPETRRLVTKDQIVTSLENNDFQVLDARSNAEFCGTDVKSNKRGGAIPGAFHLEWSDLIDPATDRFKSAEELQRLFENAGVDLSEPVASHCQSGGRASVMAFGLELMGAKDARNYYPGWSEWGNREDTPIVVREAE